MKVCIGGTFNILHEGHQRLVNKAIEKAGPKGSLLIGLASKDFVKNKINIRPYGERLDNLKKYLIKKKFLEKTIIKPISDKYGPTIDEDFDAIIVSPETVKTAEEINTIRKKNGKNPLTIIKIEYVLAKDGLPISSSRINNKEIDENGNILKKD